MWFSKKVLGSNPPPGDRWLKCSTCVASLCVLRLPLTIQRHAVSVIRITGDYKLTMNVCMNDYLSQCVGTTTDWRSVKGCILFPPTWQPSYEKELVKWKKMDGYYLFLYLSW